MSAKTKTKYKRRRGAKARAGTVGRLAVCLNMTQAGSQATGSSSSMADQCKPFFDVDCTMYCTVPGFRGQGSCNGP